MQEQDYTQDFYMAAMRMCFKFQLLVLSDDMPNGILNAQYVAGNLSHAGDAANEMMVGMLERTRQLKTKERLIYGATFRLMLKYVESKTYESLLGLVIPSEGLPLAAILTKVEYYQVSALDKMSQFKALLED